MPDSHVSAVPSQWMSLIWSLRVEKSKTEVKLECFQDGLRKLSIEKSGGGVTVLRLLPSEAGLLAVALSDGFVILEDEGEAEEA